MSEPESEDSKEETNNGKWEFFEKGNSLNPISKPLQDFFLKLIESGRAWEFPYVPQLIQILVFTFILLILSILYPTIGLAAQIGGIFKNHILEAREKFQNGGLLEKSCYCIAIGIYISLGLPFWIITLPFLALGFISQLLGDVFWFLLATGIIFFALKSFLPETTISAIRQYFRQ